MDVCFMVRIRHDDGAWIKGVEVAESANAALQSFHAQFGAYGYGNKPECDYVQCLVVTVDGRVVKCEVDDRRPKEVEA